MPEPPSPPPPRADVPKPEHMTDERYTAFLEFLAEESPTAWRDTDGTLYVEWVSADMDSSIGPPDSWIVISPRDPNYGRFITGLLPQFDYQGREVPHAASPDHDAEAG
jgi:hypothetical protein